MAWRFLANLDEVFAEVSFESLDIVLCKEVIELDFLCDHRFSFDNIFGVVCFAEFEDGALSLRCGFAEVYDGSIFGCVLCEHVEIDIEMFEGVLSDGGCACSEFLIVFDGVDGFFSFEHESGIEQGHGLSEGLIFGGSLAVFDEA